MQLATQEAQRLKHDHLGTEHLLLGLVKEGTGLASGVMSDLRLNLDDLRQQIERRCHGPNTANPPTNPRQTGRIQRVFGYASEEATLLNHAQIGTEHLLLAVMREPESTAAKALAAIQCTPEQVRAAIVGSNTVKTAPGDGLRDRAVRDIRCAAEKVDVSPATLQTIADALIKAGWRPQS